MSVPLDVSVGAVAAAHFVVGQVTVWLPPFVNLRTKPDNVSGA